MLTDKEQEWLTARKKACTRCGKVPSRCSQDQRNGCYRTGLPVWDLRTTVPFYAFRDAAEFEARVSRRLAVMLYMFQGLAERVEGYARKLDMEMEKEKYKC